MVGGRRPLPPLMGDRSDSPPVKNRSRRQIFACNVSTVFWLSIYGVHIGATWRIRLNHACAAAMRPYVKLLCPLVTGCGWDRLVQWLAADDVMLSRTKVAGGVRDIGL